MSNNINENMKSIIEGWGIPDILELRNKNIKFIFNSNEIKSNDEIYQGLMCRATTTKFCLYDIDKDEEIFIMDFIEHGKRANKLSNCEPYLTLRIINVIHPKYREKGIATYYLEKLRDYAIKENISLIEVHPNPNDNIFKGQNKENRLEIEELKKFYESKSLPNLKFKII